MVGGVIAEKFKNMQTTARGAAIDDLACDVWTKRVSEYVVVYSESILLHSNGCKCARAHGCKHARGTSAATYNHIR